jgi:hypothetical protein
VARHIWQACPVWIYTQSNITSIIFTCHWSEWVQYTNTEKNSKIALFGRGEIPLTGWKFVHINTHKWAGLVANTKVQRWCHKLFLTTVKTMLKQQNCCSWNFLT